MKMLQIAYHVRALFAEHAEHVFLRVLEVAAEDAEPDDAGRIGVGPHHAQIEMMKERHARTLTEAGGWRLGAGDGGWWLVAWDWGTSALRRYNE